MKTVVAALVVILGFSASTHGQGIDGHVSLMLDTFPSLDTAEGRVRIFAKYERDFGSHIHLNASGFWDGLYRHREGLIAPGDSADVGFGLWEPLELSVEGRWQHADLRVGWSRVSWGRLDEFLPTDVINPQDLTRFFLEGRAEGRMPVGMVRARWLPSDRVALEGIYVPLFRSGRFDQLHELTAPFNLTAGLPVERQTPLDSAGNVQGGFRASITSGRVDWSVSAYRGFEPLPLLTGGQFGIIASYPRFTMIGGDFETVRGQWGVRGEIAAFVDRTIQLETVLATAPGHSLETGLGVDRRAGDYRISGTVMFSNRVAPTVRVDRREVTIVGSVDRSFARDTRSVRVLGVYNPSEESAFGRVIANWSVRDNVALEGSVGVFGGDGVDLLARFSDRDFLYARLKVFF